MKKSRGFYKDLAREHNSEYIIYEIHPERARADYSEIASGLSGQ
ncbi:MAG: hypothetical protein OXH92_15015 [Bryobacterales bacterium]|nr:hypothetical protein [Bryobacterales bacterium]MDE0292716.1 hypothetical protein [Bryobacterales bacterium]MDE0435313.1 hypothetical protein [Bryobacterales bacterium]